MPATYTILRLDVYIYIIQTCVNMYTYISYISSSLDGRERRVSMVTHPSYQISLLSLHLLSFPRFSPSLFVLLVYQSHLLHITNSKLHAGTRSLSLSLSLSLSPLSSLLFFLYAYNFSNIFSTLLFISNFFTLVLFLYFCFILY